MTASDDLLGARSLPDEYASLRFPSGERVLALVSRRWGDRPEGERRQLAQVLLAILEPLNFPGAEITEELRTACEQAVADWVRAKVPVAELLDGLAPHRATRGKPEDAAWARRLVRLVSAEASATADGRCSARVTLERSGQRCTVRAPCRADRAEQLRGGAEATLEAVREGLPGDAPRVELRDVATFEAFDHVGVIVSVSVTEGRQQITVVGVCPDVGAEPVRAAALAALSAVNRRLGIG